jgi:hypothetical protein
MALTKLPKNAIADGAIDDSKIEDGTIQNQEIQGSLTNEKFAGSIANDRLANSSITVAGSTVSLGASITIAGDTDWQALTVADGSTQVITEAGKGYFLDTNAGVIEVFLPSSPTRGDTVVLADYSGTFGTNQIIINTGGENIDSTVGSEFKVTTNNAIVECVYVDAAKGWLVYLNQAAGTTPSGVMNAEGGYDTVLPLIEATGGTITTSGDYKIHAFTGDGCFTISTIRPASTGNVDYLVVAGGGAGNTRGAGGAGGARAGMSCRPAPATYIACGGLPVSATTYPITVGGGGAASNGSNSVFSTITSTGGGRGGAFGSPPGNVGQPGGSGGGGGAQLIPTPGPGGTGNTPPTSPSQGNPGGAGSTDQATFTNGGGGGGWATAGSGSGGTSTGTKAGGAGQPVTIIFGCAPQPFYTPNPCATGQGASATGYFAGGGGGTVENTTPGSSAPYTYGGIGGGGRGVFCQPSPGPIPATSGTANTGGGGGYQSTGGKGIVLIRYKFQ